MISLPPIDPEFFSLLETDELTSALKRAEQLKKEMDEFRPLKPEIEQRIMQRFRLDWNYHSNSIEGNSYTYGETKALLLHGLTASGKPFKDSLEIRGHQEAIKEVEEIVKNDVPLTELTIRNLHKLILGDAYQTYAQTSDGQSTSKTVTPGKYKDQPNHVKTATGETFFFAEPIDVAPLMKELVDWINSDEASKLNPIIVAAYAHYRFVRIHPFDDGNGRISRILMNLVLMRAGYPPAVIPSDKKEDYYRALHLADAGAFSELILYIMKQAIRSEELWLSGAKGYPLDDPIKELRLIKAQILREDESSDGLFNRSKQFVEYSLAFYAKIINARLFELNELFAQHQSAIRWVNQFGSVASISFRTNTKELTFQEALDRIKDTGVIKKVILQYQWSYLKTKNLNIPSLDFNIAFNLETEIVHLTSSWNKAPAPSFPLILTPSEVQVEEIAKRAIAIAIDGLKIQNGLAS